MNRRTNKMANIKMRHKKDGSRVFEIRVMIDGENFRCTYPDKKSTPIPEGWSDKKAWSEAVKESVLFENNCKQRLVSNDRRTLTEYMHFVIDLKEQTKALSPTTIDGYRIFAQRIDASKLGKKKVRDISVKDLNIFYSELSKTPNLKTGEPLSANTILHYHKLISSVLKQACLDEIITHNPAQNATLPKVIHKEAVHFKPEEIHAIINALQDESKRCRAVIITCIGTGLRRGEIAGLKWSDIDFTNRTIKVHHAVIWNKKNKELQIKSTKTYRERIITVEQPVLDALSEWKQEQTALFGVLPLDAFCFAYMNPQIPVHPDSINTLIARFKKRNGINLDGNTHAFRHTQASVVMQSGDIMQAKNRLGHSRASTTYDIYGHMMPQTDIEASKRIGEVLFRQGKKA